MAYVRFAAFHVPVLHVHQCLKTLIFIVYLKKKVCYQPVTDCTYWPVLGSYNNWNIIHLPQKSTSFETFDDINQVVLDRISDNMASLAQPGLYSAINTYDTTKNEFDVIQFISDVS